MAKNPILKIGIIGVDSVAGKHAAILKRLKRYEIVGVYDKNPTVGEEFARQNKIKFYYSWKELVEDVDVIDLAVNMGYQYEICQYTVKKAKHLFVVNRLNRDIEKAAKLVELVEEAGVVIQFHSKYRFQEQYLQILPYIYFPLFIESLQNLKRSKEVNDDFWFQEMFSRIQWILSLVNSLPKKVSGDGVSVSLKGLKVLNTRLEFDNACIANLTLNGATSLQKDELSLFHPKLIIQINLKKNRVDIESFVNPKDLLIKKEEQLLFSKSQENTWKANLMNEAESEELIVEKELKAFYDSVVFGKKVDIGLSNAFQSLEIMNSISIV